MSKASTGRRGLRPWITTIGLSLALGALFVVPSPVATALSGFGWQAIAAALLATAISFWAVGVYDRVWHDIVGTGVCDRRAHRAGMACVAIGQFTGLSSLTSTFLRSRVLRDLPFKAVGYVSAGVALSFSAIWSLLALAGVALTGAAAGLSMPPGLLVLGLGAVLVVTMMRLLRQQVLPLRSLGLMALACVVDLMAAACVLYVLLPASATPDFAVFFFIAVLAIGAGILSHLPMGLGALDLMLWLLLPQAEPAALAAALIGYRLFYMILPAALAALWIQRHRHSPAAQAHAPAQAPALWDLAAQSGQVFARPCGAAYLGKAPGCTVSLGDPVGWSAADLSREMRRFSGVRLLYKSSARMTARLRALGWRCLHIADDAVLDPQRWTETGRARQTLRRKLRQAEQAQVAVTEADILPHAAMARIAAAWATAHGGEMGFSMGRFDPDLVRRQRVFLITRDGTLCGFVTFFARGGDWLLDLVRHGPDLPDGAMHLAIVTAIATARAEGATRFNLGAVPARHLLQTPLGRSRAGLVQFKQGFGPRWTPLYAAAPDWPSLVFGLASTAWMIHQPTQRLRGPARKQLNSPAYHAIPQATPGPDHLPHDETRTPHDEPAVKAA